ncbi:hypothetical protein ILUMI_18419, partial [Ignelater luminosus]
RPLTVHKLLAELENIEDGNHYKYDVYITPPTDAGNDIDKVSGEEDCQDPDRLNRNQLDAEAELYINDKPVTEESNVEDNTPTTSSIPSNPLKKLTYRRGNDKQDCRLGESVVYNFADVLQTHFENLKFSLFFDNFFTSVKLVTTLGERRIGETGTVRVNRTANCNLSNDQFVKRQKIDKANNILAVRWKDNSIVILLSNQYGVKPLHYSTKEKKKVYIPQPNVVSMYNKYMGGVDQFDNNIDTYRISMRGKNGTCQSLCRCSTMNDAWRLARNVGKSLDNLGFRREVAQALLKKYEKIPLRNEPTSSAPDDPAGFNHLRTQVQKRPREAHR